MLKLLPELGVPREVCNVIPYVGGLYLSKSPIVSSYFRLLEHNWTSIALRSNMSIEIRYIQVYTRAFPIEAQGSLQIKMRF